MGDMDVAKKLIDTSAKVCSAHVTKFQKRHNIELLTPQEYNAPHPVPANSYGETYGAHREFLEFNVGQHKELQEECRLAGIEYSSSVWDVTSAKEIASLNPRLIKLPSATNQHYELQPSLSKFFRGEIHRSEEHTSELQSLMRISYAV